MDAAKATELVNQGIEAHRAGDLDKAEGLYNQALSFNPKEKFAYYDLGLIYQGKNQLDKAEQYYRFSIASDPKFVLGLINLAVIRSNAGSLQEAKDLYRCALGLDPTNATATLNLANVVQKLGDQAGKTSPRCLPGRLSTAEIGGLLFGLAAVIAILLFALRRTWIGWLSRSEGRVALGLYFLLLAVYLITASGHFYSTDHVQVYWTTRSLVEDKSLAIPPIIGTSINNDKHYSTSEPAQALASAPLYVLGRAVGAASPRSVATALSGHSLGMWGGDVPIFFVSLFNQFLAPVLCVLVYLFCLSFGFSILKSLFCGMVYGVGTMAWVGAHEYFQHPLETFFLLLALYYLVVQRHSLTRRNSMLAGVSLGLAFLTRANTLFTAPVFGLYFAWIALRLRVREEFATSTPRSSQITRSARAIQTASFVEWPKFVAFLLPQIAAFALLLYINQVRFGDPLQSHGESSKAVLALRYIPIGLYGFILSPGRSFFLYSPPTLAGVWMFKRFTREHFAESMVFLGLIFAYLLSYSAYLNWSGAGCWGPRYLEPIVPFMVIPAAYLLHRKATALVLLALTIGGIVISLLGVVINPVYAEQWRGMWGNSGQTSTDYLFVPRLSPPVIHAGDFVHGRNWDLWLQFILHHNGLTVFVAVLLIPLALLSLGLVLVRGSGLDSRFGSSLRAEALENVISEPSAV